MDRKRTSTGIERFREFGHAFPAGYREEFSARAAVPDIEMMARLTEAEPIAMSLYRPLEAPEGTLRFQLALPGLQVKGGKNVRVYNNQIFDNNEDNFAPKGNIVAQVPRGTGMFVMANDYTEVFGNTIKDNKTVSLAIISYLVLEKPPADPGYDAYPEAVYIHDNTFMGNGTMPDPLVLLLAGNMTPTPDVIIDGCIAADKNNDDGSLSNCLGEGSAVTFMNADLCGDAMGATSDPATVACTQPALPTE